MSNPWADSAFDGADNDGGNFYTLEKEGDTFTDQIVGEPEVVTPFKNQDGTPKKDYRVNFVSGKHHDFTLTVLKNAIRDLGREGKIPSGTWIKVTRGAKGSYVKGTVEVVSAPALPTPVALPKKDASTAPPF